MMSIAVRYDLEAGENLSSLLAQLNDKVTAFAQYRAGLRASQLDCTPGQWQGTARDQFENGGGQFGDGYASQQRALQGMADEALRIKGQVDQANQEYLSARRQTANVS
jgi:hypothetical protein